MSEWREYNLGEIAEVVPGYAFKGKDFTNNGVPIVKIGDINPPLVNLSECQKIAPEKVIGLGKFKLTKGDFVLAMTGATIGKVGRYVSEEVGYLNQRVAKFNERPGISDKRFLYHLITSHKVSSEIINRGLGSAQPNVSGRDIESILVDIPPLPTQKAIAEILSSLDDKIELNNQINQNLEALAQALFKQWFMDFEFPNENGEPYKSSGGEMIDSELGEIPEGWEVVTLDKLLTVKYGKDHKTVLDGNIPIYGSGGIMRFGDRALYDKVSILIPRKGTLSNLFFLRRAFWSVDTMFYTEIHSAEFAEFLFFWIKSLDIASMNVGSAVPSMTTKVLNQLLVVKPDNATIKVFHEMVKCMLDSSDANTKESDDLKNLRDTLLPKLISGELEINESLLEPTF